MDININNVNLEVVCTDPKDYPIANIPEVALVGRSNVGKSSLINYLINRKRYAKVSGTPGKTRTVNFYNVDEKLRLVDLPGYGYAKLSKVEQQKFEKIMDSYFYGSDNLKNVLILVDIRHKPSELDVLMYEFTKHINIPCTIIVTKTDKITKSKQESHISNIKKTLKLDDNVVLIKTSSEKRIGYDEVWSHIKDVVRS